MKLREDYLLQLKMFNQTYRGRLGLDTNSKDRAFWGATFEKLYCLGMVVEKNHSSLDEEELREFIGLYKIADIIHDPKSPDDKKNALNTLNSLIDSLIPRYAYLMEISEDNLRNQMNENYKVIGSSQLAYERSEGGIITGRKLRLRQFAKVQDDNVLEDEGHIRNLERERIVAESALKKQLAELLKRSYENIKEFERNFETYKDFRHNISDIKNCLNPIIRSQRIHKMQEHITKLTRYHSTISALYNNLYYTLTTEADIQYSELQQVETLFFLYATITTALKGCIGDYPIGRMEKRRIRLQEHITKYNEYIDQITAGNGDQPKRF